MNVPSKAWLAILLVLTGSMADGTVSAQAADSERFIEELGDIPLMTGFAVVADSVVDFDAPTGRIVRLAARGDAEPDAVRSFYRQSLPNLGWHRRGNTYVREGEALTIEIVRTDGQTVVHYGLAPARH